MKKALIIIGIVLVVLVAAAAVLPVIFKDDIKSAIDEELAASVNADVIFDVDNFSLSLFSNFPSITASMKEIGVINRAPFEGEVLFVAEEFNIEINLGSILFDDNPSISGITLVRPLINIKVLEDGSANYDITFPSEEEEVSDEETGEFSISIDHWEVIEGEFIYDDATIPYYMRLVGFNHTGNGDFTQDVFDLRTNSHADSVFVGYDGDMYIEGKRADIDATITISEDISKYEFKENKAMINDFALSFDGWFFMGSDYYDMDITYGAVDNTFKSLLSLVPGMYTSDFEDIEAEGNLSFSGQVKGKYTDTEMPAFNVALLVEDAMFKYPDLPTAVENIAMDMKVDNPDGNIDNTSINISKFHMDLGNNPIDATMSIANLVNYPMKANLKAALNLGELAQMFPVEGLDMKGNFKMDISAEGTYDSTMETMPVINGSMAMENGYVKSSEFPIPLENMHMASTISNSTGKMKDFVATVNDFSMVMDGEKFEANLTFKDLVNYTWDLNASGGVDLEKMTSIFPLEGMELSGKIGGELHTKGNYASVEAEQYDQLPTSGSIEVTNLVYKDAELPYDVTIKGANGTFNPSTIQLNSYEGTVGRSDMKMSGQINNYMGYIFNDNELLSGTFDFNSNLLDLNEMMPESEEEGTTEDDTTTYEVIPVPKNIDFILNSNIKKVVFMDLEINDASGAIIVRDGVVNMDDLKFNMLGGDFLVGGAYDTKNPDKPMYDFKLKIDDLGIKESFQAFSIVKALAPLAKDMNGKISTDFTINGELAQDFMPKLETITGSGLLKIAQAALQDSKLLTGLTSATKLKDTKSVTLRDVAMAASIKDGRLSVKPFNINLGDHMAEVSGSTGIDGSLLYDIGMEVPAGQFGSQLTSVSNTLGMGEVNEDTMVPLNIVLGGTYKDPKFQLVSSEQKEQVKEALAEKAKEEAKEAGKETLQNLTDGTDAGKVVSNLLGGDKSDTTKTTDSTKTDTKEKIEDAAKDAVKNLLNRKKKKNNDN